MIKTKTVEIIPNKFNWFIYERKGYSVKIDQPLIIKVEDLPHNRCKIPVECICDICGKDVIIEYEYYYNSTRCRRESDNTSEFCCSVECSMIKMKRRRTEIYGSDMPINDKNSIVNEKRKKTMIERHGSEYTYELEKYRENTKNIVFEKYGVDICTKSKEIINKRKKTNLERYGVEEITNWHKFDEKSKKTCLEKYGVENSMQNKEYFEKQRRSSLLFKFHEKTNLFYQGSYELDFIEYCVLNNIEISKPDKSIQLIFNGKKRYYHPDFMIVKYNLIVEIKSTYTFEKEKEENLLKKEYSIKSDYNYIFIIDKNYEEFEKLIKKYEEENK